MKKIIFSTLAINQTRFWIEVAFYLSENNIDVEFISFDEESNGLIEKSGFKYLNVYKDIKEFPVKELSNANNICLPLSHEKITYNTTNTIKIEKKFNLYYKSLDRYIKESSSSSKTIVIQELGGFISVQSLFNAAKDNNVAHVFIEPSFFKNRVFFVLNSNQSIRIDYTKDIPINPIVSSYIKNIVTKKSIAIPLKDIFNYQNSINKILSLHKIRRLFSKVYLKFILSKEQEFNHLSNYVFMFLKMVFNQYLSKVIGLLSSELPTSKYIYIPLHVPNDMALTIRSPEFVDQLSLVDFICRASPLKYKVLIKEHPAMIGMIGVFSLRKLLKKYDNLIVLNPNMNNFDILKGSSVVVTINSKAGMESLILNKKTITLGDAFYDTYEGANKTHITDLPVKLNNISSLNSAGEIGRMLSAVYSETCYGELYVLDSGNVSKFGSSILEYIKGF
jgi:hypothetical protein